MAAKGDSTEFTVYEKMPEDTNCWQSRKLNSIKKWVAMEKVHGANFSFTTDGGGGVRVAKRGGYLKDSESFFGVQRQKGFLEGETEKTRKVFAAVLELYGDVADVTVYGELFGGYYPHSSVPVCPGVIPVQMEVLYCSDLRFIAYDIAVTRSTGRAIWKCFIQSNCWKPAQEKWSAASGGKLKGKPGFEASAEDYLDYDVCMQLLKNSGFLYAEPLCTGSLQTMLGYPLGFQTKIPHKLGLPSLEGRSNTAEGIVIKPLKNVVLETSKGPRRVIFKRKVEKFLERKQRTRPSVATGKNQYSKQQADLELLKYEMYALVTEQRAVNVISKHGLPGSEEDWEAITEDLVGDVLEELSSDHQELWSKCRQEPLLLEQIMEELGTESSKVVMEYREKLKTV